MLEQQALTPESPSSQVDSDLLARFEAKQRTASERGLSQRELLREAVIEHPATASVVPLQTPPPAHPAVIGSGGEGVAGEVAKLVTVAVTGNLSDAIGRAQAAGPHVLAALHEQLVDVYWQKLVESGRVLAE